MNFQIVCLSIFSVLTLCLKEPQIGYDTIHLGLFPTVGEIQLKNKKNSPVTMNNHLLERISLTVIYSLILGVSSWCNG